MTSENRKDSWGIPKSAVINFAALIVLFIVIFLFHGLGNKLVSEKSKPGAPAEIASTSAAPDRAAGKDTEKIGEGTETKTASGKNFLKQDEGEALPTAAPAPKVKGRERKRIESGQHAANVQNTYSGPAVLTVTIEELDGDAARQQYLVSNQDYILEKPRTAPAAAPAPPAQEDDFIPFEHRKN